MRSKKLFSNAKSIFLFVLTILLASAIAPAQTRSPKFKVLHTFKGAPNDGQNPLGLLVRDSEGNLYGTTNSGGKGRGRCGDTGCGTVFKMSSTGKLIWLHSLTFPNGAGPMAGVLRNKAGNMYGTTTFGGSGCSASGCGVVFELDGTGQTETVLHRFKDGVDGELPESLLVEDNAGNLCGTTYEGGAYGYGTAFVVDKERNESILHSFAGPVGGGGDGAFPYPGVIRDAAGNVYGVTADGGAVCCGSVYQIDKAGSETLLYSFGGGSDGDGPFSVLVADSAGNLYGTTKGGGNSECGGTGCGVVFELSPHSGGNGRKTSSTPSVRGRIVPTDGNPWMARWFEMRPGTFTARPMRAVPLPTVTAQAAEWFSSWTPPARKRCCIASRAVRMVRFHGQA